MDENRVTGSLKKAAGTAERIVGDVTGDQKTELSGRGREAAGTAEDLVGQAKDAVRRVADQASDVAGEVYDRGRRYIDEGRQRYPEAERYYRDGRDAVSGQVQESPIAALVVAGAVGYLAAILIHGRR